MLLDQFTEFLFAIVAEGRMPQVVSKGSLYHIRIQAAPSAHLRTFLLDQTFRHTETYLRNLQGVGEAVVEDIALAGGCQLGYPAQPTELRGTQYAVAISLEGGTRIGSTRRQDPIRSVVHFTTRRGGYHPGRTVACLRTQDAPPQRLHRHHGGWTTPLS